MSRAGADAARASPTRGTHRGDAMAVGDDAARALFAWGCGEDGQLGLDDARMTARERCAASPRRVAPRAVQTNQRYFTSAEIQFRRTPSYWEGGHFPTRFWYGPMVLLIFKLLRARPVLVFVLFILW